MVSVTAILLLLNKSAAHWHWRFSFRASALAIACRQAQADARKDANAATRASSLTGIDRTCYVSLRGDRRQLQYQYSRPTRTDRSSTIVSVAPKNAIESSDRQ